MWISLNPHTYLAEGLTVIKKAATQYKRHLSHKRKYSSGTLVASKDLVRLATKRNWNPAGIVDNDKPSINEAFECLVCKRISERMKMAEAGFSSPLPYAADEFHYGCQFPSRHKLISKVPDSGSSSEDDDFWRDEYAASFVKSVLLGEKISKGGLISEDDVNALMSDVEVSKVVKYIVASEGERGVMVKGEEIVRRRIKHLGLLINEEKVTEGKE